MLYRSIAAAKELDLKHWHYSKDKDGIAWLYADREGESANSLSDDMMEELDRVFRDAESSGATGLALMSAKPTGFILGADIREFADLTDEAKVSAGLKRANDLFDAMENSKLHIVCGINGACLGGGFELALICDYRIAVNKPSTRVGLPEVKLGIFPGFGGTARLTQLIGGKDALPLMLTGKMVRPGTARGLGMVDKLVDEHESLEWAVRDAILKKRKSKGASLTQKLSNSAPARKLLAGTMEKKTAAKVRREHYPAPFQIIDNWKEHGGNRDAMFKSERETFPAYMVSDTAKNLQRVYHLMERLKSFGKTAKKNKLAPVKRVHVIGAGTMGADIAAWAAFKGYEVTLQDLDQGAIDAGLKSAQKLFRKRLRNKAESKAAETRIRGDEDGSGVARADLIIEAIVEKLEIKSALFKDLEPRMKPDAILATNTSSIRLQDLANGLKNPKRLVGIHFFNPVALMPLVEVIFTKKTDQTFIDRASAFVTGIGKLPLPVMSAPGFLVNRALVPYTDEAYNQLEAGHSMEDIDEAAETFGMPMGPFEMIDMVGLDVGAHVAKILLDKIPAPLQAAVDAGNLGKKTGKGFYAWKDRKPVKEDTSIESEAAMELGKICVEPMINEAELCVKEGIVADADLADAGMIFGAGFPPFRGGPLHYKASR